MTETDLQTNSIPQAVFLLNAKSLERCMHVSARIIQNAYAAQETVKKKKEKKGRKEKREKKRVSKRAQEGGLKKERESYSCQVRSKGG